MWGAILVLGFFMLISGLIGGAVNYLIGLPSSDDADDGAAPKVRRRARAKDWFKDEALYRSLVLGVAAALVVPVFLQLAAVGTDGGGLVSRFVTEYMKTDGALAVAAESLFTIIGFCVLAAVSSRAFLQTMSQRLMERAEKKASEAVLEARAIGAELDGKSKAFERQITDLEDNVEEAQGGPVEDVEETPADDDPATLEVEPVVESHAHAFVIDDVDRKILAALAAKSNVRRSIKGIREYDPSVGEFQAVRNRLNVLHAHNYVRRFAPIKEGSNLPRWKIATNGWAAIDDVRFVGQDGGEP